MPGYDVHVSGMGKVLFVQFKFLTKSSESESGFIFDAISDVLRISVTFVSLLIEWHYKTLIQINI